MSIESISFLPPLQAIALEPGAAAGAAGATGRSQDFASWFTHELASANAKLVDADRGLARLAAGDATNLHQVMLGLEEARLSFQLMVQVRNKLLEGYQDILRMQV